MDIYVDIRGLLEIHVWICYGFSGQSKLVSLTSRRMQLAYDSVTVTAADK